VLFVGLFVYLEILRDQSVQNFWQLIAGQHWMIKQQGQTKPGAVHSAMASVFTLERDCTPMNLKEWLTNRLGSVWFLTLTAISPIFGLIL
jgi:hypothetical protein